MDDPAPILPILEALKQDPSEDVRRSVANNLNDIAKDNPAVVVEVLGRWQAINTPEMDWLIRHALRTLIKHADRIEDPADTSERVNEAFRIMQSGRPGPVSVEMCWDTMAQTAPVVDRAAPALSGDAPADPAMIDRAVDLLRDAKCPMIMVGSGAQVLQYLEIGDGATVGAGSLVTKPVPAGKTAVGMPARYPRG